MEETPQYISELVSIVTVYYNRADLVRISLLSLCAQTYKNIEIIVVDDGSTDSTVEEILKFDDTRIRLIKKANSGFTDSIKLAVQAAKGRYIAVHGSGDYSYSRRIEEQHAVLQRREEVGVVGCWIENEQLGRRRFVREASENNSDFYAQIFKDHIFTHGEVMFRKELYDLVGGYRDFFTYAQDYDLWLRMSPHCQYFIVPDILYRRFAPPGTVRGDPDKLLIQLALSELARQCAEQRQVNGEDLIDQFGHHAYLFMKNSKSLGDSLVGKGANILIHMDDPRSLKLVKSGVRQAPTLRNLIYAILLSTYGSGFYKRIVRPGMRYWREVRTERSRLIQDGNFPPARLRASGPDDREEDVPCAGACEAVGLDDHADLGRGGPHRAIGVGDIPLHDQRTQDPLANVVRRLDEKSV